MFNMRKQRKGYAITFEVMMTLAFMVYITTATFSILNAFNVQRYMSTILTSTATSMAKFGGTNTNAANLINYNPVVTANEVAEKMIGPEYNVKITGSPNKVTTSNQTIVVTGTYTYPNSYGFKYLFDTETPVTIRIEMDSLMKPGALL